jgi:hypothetical protein
VNHENEFNEVLLDQDLLVNEAKHLLERGNYCALLAPDL